ncbi:hypothetical protein AAG906_011745 [Vitis piasezkii]
MSSSICESDLVYQIVMVSACAKMGNFTFARNLFDKMPHKNSIAGSAMTLGYAQSMLIHQGTTVNSDHYAAYIKDENTGQWWVFNDEHVSNPGHCPFGEGSSSSAAKPVQTESSVHLPSTESMNGVMNGDHINIGHILIMFLDAKRFCFTVKNSHYRAVKHARWKVTLKVFEVMKKMHHDNPIFSESGNQMMHRLAPLKQEIENGVQMLLPDPQVLLTLLSSLSSQSTIQKLGLKRKRSSGNFTVHRRNDRKKLKTDVLNEDTDMIISGISSGLDIAFHGGEKALDTFTADDMDSGKDNVKIIAKIWGLQPSSMAGIALRDVETCFHSKLLDAPKIYVHGSYFYLGLSESASAAFSLFLQQASFHVLFPAIMNIDVCFILVERMLDELLVLRPDSDCSTSSGVLFPTVQECKETTRKGFQSSVTKTTPGTQEQVQAVRSNYVLQFQFQEVQLKLLPWSNFAQFSEMILIAPHNSRLFYLLRCVLLRNRPLEMAYVNSEFDPKDFRIPDYIFVPGSEVKAVSHVPECPVIVFINSKSDASRRRLAVSRKELSLLSLLSELNEIGGGHGIRRIEIIESRLVGMKGRQNYETPGRTIFSLQPMNWNL